MIRNTHFCGKLNITTPTLLQKKLTYNCTGILIFLLFFIFACSKTTINTSSTTDKAPQEMKPVEETTAFNLADSSISVSTLETSLLSYSFSDSAAIDSSIKDYIYKLQLYEEAKSKGLDKDPVLLDEIETYKRLLAEEALMDSLLLNEMIVEAYDHMQCELKASHLFIALPSSALPKDTLFVYNELERIRSEAIANSNFDSLVRLYSQDRRTNKLGGSLGWFGALQMVYPIEKAAFSLKEGEISLPIRSDQGYHLINLNGKRKSRGSIQVRHLLKSIPQDADSLFVIQKSIELDSILSLARKDTSVFKTLIQNESDDFNSKSNGGLLPYISTGSRVEESFENAAYDLELGGISDIVRTSIGLHIIQLVDKRDFGSMDDNYDQIRQKIITDSRGNFLREQSMARIAQRIGFEAELNVPQDISELFNRSLLQSKWSFIELEKDKVLFSYRNGSIALSEFLNFVVDRQQFDPIEENTSVDMAIFKYFLIFKKQKLKELAIIDLYKNSTRLNKQINLIKRDLVCAKYLNQTLIERAVADTTGQRRWFNANIDTFKKKPRAYATIINSSNKSTVDSLLSIYKGPKPYRLKRGVRAFYFSKNFYFLNDDDKRRLTGLFSILQKNPNYIVEIGGHRDVAEESYVSTSRISEVVGYLRGLGLEITRIKEADYAETRLADRFDWTKNQRVSIQFFSNDLLDLIPTIAETKEDILKVQRKWFTNEEAPYLWDSLKEATVIETEGTYSFVEVRTMEEPGYLSLREVRGRVINSYQMELERELKENLNRKYPIKLNSDEINRLTKSLLKKI